MNRNHWIDTCPTCREMVQQFYLKKAFPVKDEERDGWSGVEAYYCPGCDKILVAVGFEAADRDVFFVERGATNGFAVPASPPGRAHSCYLPRAVSSAVLMREPTFQGLRRIRSQIGARTQPDEPRLALAFDRTIPDISKIRNTLDQWLINSQSGSVTSLESGPHETFLHIQFTNRGRAQYMVDRLFRKFDLPPTVKTYYYNEGRRYAVSPEP